MSIESTIEITRDVAIKRLSLIMECIKNKDYLELENNSFEDSADLANFVDNTEYISIEVLNKWTDTMLADLISRPFFRYSMFENYIIVIEPDNGFLIGRY